MSNANNQALLDDGSSSHKNKKSSHNNP